MLRTLVVVVVLMLRLATERIRFNEQERHNERECPERTLNCKYCKEPFHFKNIKVEKEKIHEHERACAYEHLQPAAALHHGHESEHGGLQPQGLELAGHKLLEAPPVLRELRPESSLLSTHRPLGLPVQGAEPSVVLVSSSASTSAAATTSYALAAPVALASSSTALLPPPPPHPSSSSSSSSSASATASTSTSTLVPTLSVSTSFTPLPSSVGAALELQLHSEKTKVAELGRRCVDLEVKAGTFENVVCVLNREVERFATTMEASNRQHRLDQDKIEALSNKDLTVAEMEGRLREMAATTFDGVFVWRISDFTKKRQDAIAGRAPAMFSPAFYTSKYGYKMCLRIYLNGDGTGRGSHLSLFFVVMRGLSDALLKWPFNQKHIIDAFRPDVTSSSFQRPVSEMNIASGCPLFCPLSKLDSKNSYIRDDTIFIKAIVDLTGL
ncbi:hypothetical protein CRUP_023090 [Coryphaenoides rupestris]|nr:hypothetical protein CRUP_023090 [Coryphaenoides rupestris]